MFSVVVVSMIGVVKITKSVSVCAYHLHVL